MGDWTDLKAFVGGNPDGTDDSYISECYVEAILLVQSFVGTNDIPSNVLDRCYLECGSELFHRRNAPNGIAQFQGLEGAPVRIARDPMIPVYALVKNYMVVGI